MPKAPLDVNDEFFTQLQDALKGLTSLVTDWQKKDAALSQLAENHATQSNEAPGFEHDARVASHKSALRKAMAEQAPAGPSAGGMGVPVPEGILPPPPSPAGPMGAPPGLPPSPLG